QGCCEHANGGCPPNAAEPIQPSPIGVGGRGVCPQVPCSVHAETLLGRWRQWPADSIPYRGADFSDPTEEVPDGRPVDTDSKQDPDQGTSRDVTWVVGADQDARQC